MFQKASTNKIDDPGCHMVLDSNEVVLLRYFT